MYLKFIKDYTMRALQITEMSILRNSIRNNDKEEPQLESDEEIMLKLEKEVIENIKKAMQSPMEVAYDNGVNLYGLPIFWKIGLD